MFGLSSIRMQILMIIAIGFIIAAVGVVSIAHVHMQSMVDSSQRTIYAQKTQTILKDLEQKFQRLQKTGQVEAYEEAFKTSIINKLRQVYYTEKPAHIYPFIIESTGWWVMRPTVTTGSDISSSRTAVQRMIELRNGDFDYMLPGNRKNWCLIQYFEPWDWIVGFTVPHTVKYAEVRTLRTMLTAIIMSITSLVLVILFVVIARTLKPIVTLTEASKAFAAGDLDKTIDITSRSELGILAGNFVKMRNAVKQHIAELKEEISARVRAGDALKESEEKFRSLFENAIEGIFQSTPEGRFINVNPAFARMHGYSSPEDVTATITDIATQYYVVPEDRREYQERLTKQGSVENFEFKARCKDGSYIWVSAHSRAIYDENGAVARYEGNMHDISERKRAEGALISEKLFSEMLINQLPGSFYMFDENGWILRWNDNLEQVTGYAGDEIRQMRALDFFSEDEREKVQREIEVVFEQGKSQVEANFLSKTGQKIPHVLTGVRLDYEDEVYLLGVGLDITERQRVEDALMESEEKYRTLFENANDAIYIAQAGRIVFCNSRTVELLGYTADEIRTTDFLTFVHPNDRQIVADRHIRRTRGETDIPDTYSIRIVQKDTTVLTVQLNVVRVEWRDEPAVLGFARDITEQKRLEELMIQNEKMLSVGGLAAGMAHEINNPLAGMVQTANVMLDRLTKTEMVANQRAAEEVGCKVEQIKAYMDKRDIPRMIEGVNESGHRLAELVDNMLSFARKSERQVSSHALTELIDKTLELAATDYDLKKQYDFRKIEIKKAYADQLPPIPCEGAKIQQVVLNILNNGAQAMQAAATKQPRFIIRLDMDTERDMICLKIEDNGPGMDAEVRKKVFEPFFTTKRGGQGTGLGFSVSYFIIAENHKGEMSVESTPGAGTTFIIRLPLESSSSGG